VYYDPSQCELMAQRLRNRGVPMASVPFTTGSTQEMASALLEAFNSGEIELFRHHQLIRDLLQLRFIERGNTYRVDAARTSEGHADLAVSFILALLAAKRNPRSTYLPFTDRPLIYSPADIEKRLKELEAAEAGPATSPTAASTRKDNQRSVLSAALEENGLFHSDNW
jgi:hypothetical protein